MMRIPHVPLLSIIFSTASRYTSVHFTRIFGQIVEDRQPSLLKLKRNIKFNLEMSHKLWRGVTCDKERQVIGLGLSGESINDGFDNSNLQVLVKNLTMLRQLYKDVVSVRAQGNKWSNALLQLVSQHDSCGLIGIFPEKIFQLETLSDIDLSFNDDLYGFLLEFTLNCPLRTLIVSHLRFSRALSAFIGNLGQLSKLDLSYCYFNETLPSSMLGLRELTSLLLSFNNFTGLIPSLNMSQNLKHLNLLGNNIQGSIPTWIWQLEGNKLHGNIECSQTNGIEHMVQIVDRASNSFSGSLLAKCFKTWKAMVAMVVDEDHNGSNFNHIAFAFVDFSFNNFEGSILEELMSFTTLISLNLSHNALAGKIPSSMGNLKELQSLDLSSNNLDGENSSQLQSLTLLSYLNLSYNRLVGKIPISN
uniref:Leucine-rich repeat-containing N-terminal plant-type domain-containing protein n=1 Tax=Glycine max TaxID=3847 RepID=K7L1W7_SOYBN